MPLLPIEPQQAKLVAAPVPDGLSKRRILIYNFVQPDDPTQKQCGGIDIYERNLERSLLEAGHEVISLSSGDRITLFGKAPRPTLEAGTPGAGDHPGAAPNSTGQAAQP